MLLALDPFLNELARLFDRTKDAGTIWITMKRTNLAPKSAKEQPEEYSCLIRAVACSGKGDAKKKRKLSAVVTKEQYMQFQASYATIMLAHMDSLKKKEKKRK